MILLGARVALVGREFVCFQVHTGAFPPAQLLAFFPLSHSALFHIGLACAAFLLWVILPKFHLSQLHASTHVYMPQFSMRQQVLYVPDVTYPLSSTL